MNIISLKIPLPPLLAERLGGELGQRHIAAQSGHQALDLQLLQEQGAIHLLA